MGANTDIKAAVAEEVKTNVATQIKEALDAALNSRNEEAKATVEAMKEFTLVLTAMRKNLEETNVSIVAQRARTDEVEKAQRLLKQEVEKTKEHMTNIERRINTDKEELQQTVNAAIAIATQKAEETICKQDQMIKESQREAKRQSDLIDSLLDRMAQIEQAQNDQGFGASNQEIADDLINSGEATESKEEKRKTGKKKAKGKPDSNQ